LLNRNNGCKKHTADRATHHQNFYKHLYRKVLRANGGIDPEYKFGTSLSTPLKRQFIESSRLNLQD